MPETGDRIFCFERSLKELSGFYALSQSSIWDRDTLGPETDISQLLVGDVVTAYEDEQLNILKQIRQVYSDIIVIGMRQEIEYADTAEQDGWPVSQEFEGIATDSCLEFCNAQGLIDALRSCIKQAKVVFSNIESVLAELDCFEDEGMIDDGHVVLRLKVKSCQNDVLDEYDDWIDWKVANLSTSERGYFTLTFHRITS